MTSNIWNYNKRSRWRNWNDDKENWDDDKENWDDDKNSKW